RRHGPLVVVEIDTDRGRDVGGDGIRNLHASTLIATSDIARGHAAFAFREAAPSTGRGVGGLP
ncbi:hypothetical protein, partial [Microbacterium sp. HMWF026]|uniref:hypothetical protein n=1 Tax=Microbacterium sp. HMWF026 TaxID=2056861 RepID=UPI001C624C47